MMAFLTVKTLNDPNETPDRKLHVIIYRLLQKNDVAVKYPNEKVHLKISEVGSFLCLPALKMSMIMREQNKTFLYKTFLYKTKLFYNFVSKFCKMEAPFIFGKLAEGQNFINRERDLENLKLNFKSGINTTLISPRRWGKSSLVNQAAEQLKAEVPELHFCFIDLFNIRSEEDFYENFATKLIRETSTKWEDWIKNGKKFISNLIPRFNVGLDPVHDFKITFDWKELKKSQDEILELPQSISFDKKIRIVVCIDEFQNIAQFGQSLAFQKKLRSIWQKHQKVTYCLYGSKRHMLSDIFENKSMPFYKFGETHFLNKIDEQYWIEYIGRQFSLTGKSISNNLSAQLSGLMENHPYFVQMFAKNIWQNTDKNCSKDIIAFTLQELLIQNSLLYHRELDNLTNKQINFLKALAEGVSKFSTKETLSTYDLGTQGNISRIKSSLENSEIIDLWGDKIEFIDPLFKLWFIQIYLGKRYSV